jgi:hypothetical protein
MTSGVNTVNLALPNVTTDAGLATGLLVWENDRLIQHRDKISMRVFFIKYSF